MGYLEMCVNGMETFEKHSLLPNLGVRLKSNQPEAGKSSKY